MKVLSLSPVNLGSGVTSDSRSRVTSDNLSRATA
jgi:hypothetical protein